MPHVPVDAGAEARPDMTPMIDVVFLMIVFFLCIPFRTLEAKLPAYLPKDRGGSHDGVEFEDQLAVRIVCDAPGHAVPFGAAARRHRLDGHRVRWFVGPRPVADHTALCAELARIAASPDSLVPDPATGGRRRMACVVEPGPEVCYDDVAHTADAARASGFDRVTFAAGQRRR